MALSPSNIRGPVTDVDRVEQILDHELAQRRASLSKMVPMQCRIPLCAPAAAVRAALARFERTGWETEILGVGPAAPLIGSRHFDAPVDAVRVRFTEFSAQAVGDETV